MLVNFEKITQDLNELEKAQAKHFGIFMLDYVGRHKAIKSKKIEAHFLISSVKVRKFTNYLRTTGHLPNLIATSEGYYVSINKPEQLKHCKSMYDRGLKIMSVAIQQAKHMGLNPDDLVK